MARWFERKGGLLVPRTSLSRRRLLRGIGRGGLVTVGLPWLEIFAGPRAWASTCDSGLPRRLVLFLWGNGNLPDRWTPLSEGTDWEPSDQLAPLAAIKHKVSVLTGYSVKVDNISPHWSGAAGLLTGQQIDGTDDDWTVAGPTLDQVVADAIGGDTIYRSIQIGIETEEVYSYTGPNAQNFGEVDPYTFYERLFGESWREPGEDSEPDPALGRRRSVLDAVMGDLSQLQSELGSADRQRLEQHLAGVEELEERLRKLEEDPPDLESCERPEAPETEYPDIDGRPQLGPRSQAMSALLAMTLACDQTRVATVQFSKALSNALYEGTTDGHHNQTHNEPDDQPEVHSITLQIMEQLAFLLETLDGVPEGDGTLLDNSVVIGASEVSEGKTHSLDEIPLLIAGGGCGRLVAGEHIRSYTGESASKAMLSVLRAMDVTASSWGEGDSQATDGLSELEL
jgi:hypothetical protein